MSAASVKELRAKFAKAKDSNKAEALYGAEADPSRELLEFMLELASNPAVYDLARIEAMKVIGLIGRKLDAKTEARAARALAQIAVGDSDEDVQSYALQALTWLSTAAAELIVIAPLLDATQDLRVRDAALALLLQHKSDPNVRTLLQRFAADSKLGTYI